MAGTKETKDLLDFALSLGNGLGNALEDGFQLSDLALLLPALLKIGDALNGIGNVPAELADLDDTELADLKAFIQGKFDIPQDKIEPAIEQGIDLGIRVANYALFLSNL